MYKNKDICVYRDIKYNKYSYFLGLFRIYR